MLGSFSFSRIDSEFVTPINNDLVEEVTSSVKECGAAVTVFSIIYKVNHIRGYPVHGFFKKIKFEIKNGGEKIKF